MRILKVLVLAIGVSACLAAPASAAWPANCYDNVGTPGNDSFFGGSLSQAYAGLAGDDSIGGGSGDDHLCGDDGADNINGGSDNDLLISGFHDGDNDTVTGGSGNDTIYLHWGADRAWGGSGNDTIWAQDGVADDVIDCGGDVDTVHTDAGAIDQIAANCENVVFN